MAKNPNGFVPGIGTVGPVDFSDDESTPLAVQEQYAASLKTVTEAKEWDLFRNPPLKEDSGSMAEQNCLQLVIKISKIVAYLLVSAIVLSCSVIAKGTILFMTSQLRDDRTIYYCNEQLGTTKTFAATLPEEEKIAWIWCIMFAFSITEILTIVRSLRILCFKSYGKPKVAHFIVVWITETAHVIGLAILIVSVLPDLDVIQGAMLTNCLCFVPGLLGLLSRYKKRDKPILFLLFIVDVAALAMQVTGFVVWPFVYISNPALWLTPVALVLVSCRWWENYVSIQSPLGIVRYLGQVKEELKFTRSATYLVVSIWKIAAFVLTTLSILHMKGTTISNLFTMFGTTFNEHNVTVSEVQSTIGGGTIPDLSEVLPDGVTAIVTTNSLTPVYVMLIQILAAYFTYIFGKLACKILMQGFGYALPINLTVPVSISLLLVMCILRNEEPCTFHGFIPDYLFYQSPSLNSLSDFIWSEYAWVWILWLLSQTWITIHIWTPKCERLATTEKLFVLPLYDGLLVDQSLALNRQRNDEPNMTDEGFVRHGEDYDTLYEQNEGLGTAHTASRNSDLVTRIHVCATMWHENKEEMMEFLKSILRLDEDQCARRNAQNFLKIIDPDYYELETHIFFDDAFEMSDHDENESQVNWFVKLLVNTLDEAASNVHQTTMHVSAPKKYPTPYGGRLVWTLPGKTKMIAHLKDKSKIRHRKRWSQVMYMYYLLGHRLMQLPISIERKEIIAEHTFLLALDGDIDFQPAAVKLLIDLMKKNKNLGAACGRIHPVGSGFMVWYQMFEYAIGHWLQKATEHTIGCVLCSPGCFSLFRGKALMDDRVMSKYTTTSNEARHYVQYDQGEDRWLCTLLLQRGYRVEYSAASDAYTHAPEGFNEFFNQRRRWVPSTMANIMDLIGDSKRTVKNNDNISTVYMWYQTFLMVGTILGPGTIFLMLVGACSAAFGIGNWPSFHYNLVPVVIFMIVCLTCKSSIQLFVAAVISMGYGIVMMAVIVAIIIQMADDGWVAPSSLFLILITGQLVLAGLMHPQELMCLPCGIIYYVTIPAMYMLLVIYSITNLNNVAWGTREVQVKKTAAELEEDKKEAEEAARKGKQKSLFGFLQDGKGNSTDDNGSIEISLAGLFKCILCTHNNPSDEKQQLNAIATSLNQMEKKLENISKAIDPQGHAPRQRRVSFTRPGGEATNLDDENPTNKDQVESDTESTVSQNTEGERDRTFLVSPYWLEDEDLKKGEVDFLSPQEEQFWKDILEKYLFPIDEDKAEKTRIAGDLKELRDKSFFAFFMLNALFVMIVFLMQLNKDDLHIEWPWGIQTNITYDETALEVNLTSEYLQLEPIGLVFVFSFALVLVIQFIAMLFHRCGTFAHIVATTTLDWYCCKKPEDVSEQALLSKDAVQIVKDLQRLDSIDETNNEDSLKPPARRTTVRNLEKNRRKTQTNKNLDNAFRERFFSIAEGPDFSRRMSSRRSTVAFKAFEARRHSILAEKRKSQMQVMPGGASSSNYGVARTSLTMQPKMSTRGSQASIIMRVSETHPGVVNLAFDPEENPRA
ncbi:chitin synthase chs-2-like isoform X1 [Neodiprion pinetum]|uniref:chitin synthase chs-2-like isoform X1 n=1 Tax=Neodiprion pinetum TaxID=441929 RepID=UPI001EDF07BB|nr:chitin synthase chs-2-like [Neodiprion pinetum]